MDMYGKNKGNIWKYWGKLTLEINRDTRSLMMEIILEWSLKCEHEQFDPENHPLVVSLIFQPYLAGLNF